MQIYEAFNGHQNLTYGRVFAFKSQAFYLQQVATNLQMSSPCGRAGDFFTIMNELICRGWIKIYQHYILNLCIQSVAVGGQDQNINSL